MVGKLLLVLLLRIDMIMVCEACGRIVGGAWGIRWCHGFHISRELCFKPDFGFVFFESASSKAGKT